jgi:CheY-like chemotaxis protein
MEPRDIHVLLIEDDDVDVMNVKRAFKKNNLTTQIVVANNGEEGLERLRDGSVSTTRLLILLDLNMPRMNGVEFLRALRADPQLSRTPVVVLTTSNEDRDKVEAYNFNVAGYLLKPVRFDDFVELMGTLNRYWTRVEMP